MIWQPIDLPGRIVHRLGDGGEQAKKPFEQKMREAAVAEDPVTAMMGDNIQLNVTIKGHCILFEKPIKTNVLEEFTAILMIPPGESEFKLNVRLKLVGSPGPTTIRSKLQTKDLKEAKAKSIEVIKNIFTDMLNDIEEIMNQIKS